MIHDTRIHTIQNTTIIQDTRMTQDTRIQVTKDTKVHAMKIQDTEIIQDKNHTLYKIQDTKIRQDTRIQKNIQDTRIPAKKNTRYKN